jgi:PTS system nitrogen regulatory IIA component
MDAPETGQEVMTLSETAQYLHLAERTVLRMAQRGEIPAAKVASQWRFMRTLVRDWLAAKMQAAPVTRAREHIHPEEAMLPLTEAIHPELMSFGLEPGPKERVFRQMLAPLLKTGFVRDTNLLLKGLIDRERMMTTAIGHGIAVPHPRSPIPGMFPEPAVALGICPQGTDFDAIDDQLVHVVFLICATRPEIHLQLMARVSWLSGQHIVARLKGASSSDEAMAAISEAREATR